MQGHPHGHGHGPSPVPPSLVQINQINAFSGPHHLTQQPQQSMGHGLQTQNGGSLDDEWKNIHVMLNCILGMVEKTKRALAILQRRGCSSPAAAAPPPGAVVAQNGTSNNGNSNSNNPSSTNGAQVESSTGDRDGSLKRLSGEIVAQTIRATEDKVAEVKRRAGRYFDHVLSCTSSAILFWYIILRIFLQVYKPMRAHICQCFFSGRKICMSSYLNLAELTLSRSVNSGFIYMNE